MKRITKYGITAAAVAGLLTAGAGAAFAAPPPTQSGTVTGNVTVETALTLQLVGTTFTVNGAVPGVTDNGVPATVATVSTNDSGYTLTAYMNDVGQTPYPGCNASAFNNAAGTATIPDSAWTDTSTGGPGAPGTAQQFAGYTQGQLSNGAGGCLPANPQAITVGGENTGPSAPSGDSFTEQLAVKVPANTPGGVLFTGTLTYLATGA